MLASRSQHFALADKENSHAPPTSRKAAGTLSGAAGPTAFKTPGRAKGQLGQSNGRTAFKQRDQYAVGDKGKLAMTVAVEPGARVLGVKDVNNRKQQAQTARKEKGKGKETEPSDICALQFLLQPWRRAEIGR